MGQSFNLDKNSPFELLAMLITIVYNVGFLVTQGATIGKKLVHVRVVNTNYQPIKFSQVIIRETLGKIISNMVFGLGYLWIAVDEKKQAWHDKIAKTYVVHDQPISQAEFMAIQQNKHSHIPLILIILGVLELIQSLIMVFTVILLSTEYERLNIGGYNPVMSYGLFGVVILIAMAQILLGAVFMFKQKNTGMISDQQKKIAKILLIVGVVVMVATIPIMINSILFPIYHLTNSIK